jgi:hypothetical protein
MIKSPGGMPGFLVLDSLSYLNVHQHMRRSRRPGHRHQPPTAGRPGPCPYTGGDAEGVGRAVSARVAKMSSMSRIPWGVMPIVC